MHKRVLVTIAAFLPLLAFGTSTFTYHSSKVQVVAVDPPASMMTIRLADGSRILARVEGGAVMTLGSIRAGDRIATTCQDNSRGQHMAITKIKRL